MFTLGNVSRVHATRDRTLEINSKQPNNLIVLSRFDILNFGENVEQRTFGLERLCQDVVQYYCGEQEKDFFQQFFAFIFCSFLFGGQHHANDFIRPVR